MAGTAVFRMVVSSDSMKNATATSQGSNRLLAFDGEGDAIDGPLSAFVGFIGYGATTLSSLYLTTFVTSEPYAIGRGKSACVDERRAWSGSSHGENRPMRSLRPFSRIVSGWSAFALPGRSGRVRLECSGLPVIQQHQTERKAFRSDLRRSRVAKRSPDGAISWRERMEFAGIVPDRNRFRRTG
jgi:hypothetical protein